MKEWKTFLIVTMVLVLTSFMACSQESLLNSIPPPGEYIEETETNLGKNRTFHEDQQLIATYYFYWYMRREYRENIERYPSTLEGLTCNDVKWHIKQLKDMTRVGIDIVLPVYWGNTACKHNWSVDGLNKFVRAYKKLYEKGYNLPKIGMFYDTSALKSEKRIGDWQEKPDLTTQEGKEFFYLMIRDFYSMIPPSIRARIGGKPIVWLYIPNFAKDYSQTTFRYINKKFQEDFGGHELYLVSENSWAIDSENVYFWGAALNGPHFDGVYSVGPGFNDTSDPIEGYPTQRRRGGKFYKNGWKQILALTKRTDNHIVAIETWNEYHEGTDVAASAEYGRKYLNITEEYIDKFKSGYVPENYPGKDLINAESVTIEFRPDSIKERGIHYVECADGKNQVVKKSGAFCLQPEKMEDEYQYMYFKVNPYI